MQIRVNLKTQPGQAGLASIQKTSQTDEIMMMTARAQ